MTSILSRLSEPSTACLMCSGRLFRPGAPFVPRDRIRAEVEAELGGDDHLLAERSESFAHEFLVDERAVDLGGIEKGDAAFDGGPEQGDHLLLVFGRAVGKTHSHAAQSEGGNFQIAFSQFAFLHC